MSVVAIDPEKGTCRGKGYTVGTIAEAVQWLADHEEWNQYWTPNPLKKSTNKKPRKTDVLSLRWVHVDCDDPSEAALERIRAYHVPPTMIVFSGGGYQAFWLLRAMIPVNGNIETLEAANKRVLADLDPEHPGTHNIDRVMRLPGTVNRPTKAKKKRGRTPVDARLVEYHPERLYDLGDFIDRSEDLLAQAGKMRRNGAERDEIHEKLDGHPHAKDQADPVRAVDRAINKVEADQRALIEEINRKHALVWIEGKLGVMWKEKSSGDRTLPEISTLDHVRVHWLNRKVGRRNPIDLWLQSPERHEYDGIAFHPGVSDVGRHFNLFQGWGVKPVAGDCSLVLAHLRDVISGGDEGMFDYIVQWLANIVQQPREKPGTALALGSGQGTGKGAIARYLRPVFGRHFLQLAGSDLLLGRFNDFIAGKLLVYADEAAWPGDKRGVDKLKSYITEERVSVDRKFIPAFEIDNYVRFIFATNRDHAAPAELDDRRYVVPTMDESRRGDEAYWKALEAERKSGGPAALLHHLLHGVKITRNLRETPKTDALAGQKLLGLDHIGQFWRAMLMEQEHHLVKGQKGSQTHYTFRFGQPVRTADLHEFYVEFAAKNRINYPASIDALGRGLRKYVPLMSKREVRREESRRLGLAPRTQVYELPPLAEARLDFEAALGGTPVEWPPLGFCGPQPEDIDA
jgi:hypothetical protein